LKNLLGSMGVHPPRMSVLNLAIMWKLMSIEGIWSPSCGIHGLIDEIAEAFTSQGGVLATGRPVEEILISKGLAVGVKTGGGDVHESRWVVSNADYKKTFLQLVNRDHLSAGFLKSVEDKPYTGSELCLYLGLNPEKVDWRAMKARHLFFTPGLDEHNPREQDNADSLEIEICLWSDTVPNMTPADKKAMVIRSSFPFSKFELYWTGEKQRTTGYQEYKKELADQLLRAAEHVLPGLASAVETREAATPLTYRDWGQRYLGSIAGWSWQARENELGGKFLIETPIRGLLMTGVYAATELLFGGVPTAVHTGGLAADHIRQSL
jgi:all-trans-retinol 13,14-reductase